MKTEIFNNQELNNYISMALTGYYPLFESYWLKDLTFRKISINTANKNVKLVFSKISRHKSSDRKRMAINLMPEEDRKVFIQSFMKLVEHNILERTRTLQ